MKNITAAFRVMMSRYKISSNEIAKKKGVSNRAINKAIGTDAVKKMNTVMEYCDLIGCSIEELMGEAREITRIESEKEANKSR